MADFRAIALDFDGTLASSAPAHQLARERAYNALAEIKRDERFLHSPKRAALLAEAHRRGSTSLHIEAWVLASLGLVREGANPVCDPLVRETAGIKAELYREISKAGLPAMPGATEFVRDAAAELGARKIAIVTTAADVDVDSFLDHHGIRTSVGFAITSGFRGGIAPERLKPDPYAYQQAARLFGVATRSTVAVEDSPIGIAAAVGAHMSVVGIATTHNREDLTKAGMVVDDFAGLREIVLPKIANVR